MIFDAAYTNFPAVCAEQVFHDGRAACPSNHRGPGDNAAETVSGRSLPSRTISAIRGYHTCLSGKMHFLRDRTSCMDSNVRLTHGCLSGRFFTWDPEFGDEPERKHEWFPYHGTFVSEGRYLRPASKQSGLRTTRVTYQSCRYLYDSRARSGEDAPVSAWWPSYIHPHDPYITRQQYWESLFT